MTTSIAAGTVKRTNWRWMICSLLFFATTINYLDRQVLSLTWKDFIQPEFHWSDANYGEITAFFSIFYAVISLFAGKVIDFLGTKKGYLLAIFVWSLAACLHAFCGWATIHIAGLGSIEALYEIQKGSAMALTVSTISVWLFLACRALLAIGESGNFPAAIKTTAQYFPKMDRAFATSIFNSGASVGALAAPLCIPWLAKLYGWEMAFIIIGALGFIWMGFWGKMYARPENSKYVNKEELAYIMQDDKGESEQEIKEDENKTIPFWQCFKYRQTWAFVAGKALTDGVWWFFLFWAPAYFSDQFGFTSYSSMGQALIFTLYFIVTVLSIGGGYLPKIFVENKGMNPYAGRMRAMLIFAFIPVLALFAQPLGEYSVWWPAIIIGLAGAAHQAWSANLFSTIGDMFPKSTVASIVGIGTMAGGLGSFAINWGSGHLFSYAEGMGPSFQFLQFAGKPAGYMIVFSICAVAYILAWVIMKLLVPKYKKIEV
ncbi:MAG: MFS transporter [Muribaculaceae bacterium]|nr:MFS transporter [Muribaculaceae bacterium]